MCRNHITIATLLASIALAGCDATNPAANPETVGPSPEYDQMQSVAGLIQARLDSAFPLFTDSPLPSFPTLPQGYRLVWSTADQPQVTHSYDSTLRANGNSPILVGNGLVLCVAYEVGSTVSHYSIVVDPVSDPNGDLPTPGIAFGESPDPVDSVDYWNDSIRILSSYPGATLHYTLDGSRPTASSATYSAPMRFYQPTTISALATAPGHHPSHNTIKRIVPYGRWNESIEYEILVDSRDGHYYPTVRLFGRTWMAQNLDWRPGAASHDPRHGSTYTPEQAVGGGLCPDGWHLPTRTEWSWLIDSALALPGFTSANVANAFRMIEPGTGRSDLFGFRATTSTFWTSTPGDAARSAFSLILVDGAFKFEEQRSFVSSSYDWEYSPTGYVRCVRDVD